MSAFARPIRNLALRIRLPGFKGMSLYHLYEQYSTGIIKGAFSLRASAISYSFFMALFPFTLFVLNLIPFIDWLYNDFQEQLSVFIESFLPPTTADGFYAVFSDIASNKRTGLLSISFVVSLFLMGNGVNAVFTGFANSYHNDLSRKLVKQWLTAAWVALLMAGLLLATVALTVYIEYVLENLMLRNYLTLDSQIYWIEIGRNASFLLAIFLAISSLYYYGNPHRESKRFFSVGAFVTTGLIMVSTLLFGYYIREFSSYNELYGSIGALLILMVYIWLNSNLILLGYELNASLRKLNHQKMYLENPN